MTDGRPRNPDSWEPPGLWAPLSGHLVLGLVKAPVVLLLLWLATLLPVVPSRGAGVLVALVAVAVGVGALIEVLVEDPFARRRKPSSPGGWDFAFVPPMVALVGVVARGWLMSGSLVVGAAMGAAWAAVEAVEIAWLRPWEPGMTQDEFDGKYAELKEMTRETFAPTWRRSAAVPGSGACRSTATRSSGSAGRRAPRASEPHRSVLHRGDMGPQVLA